MVEYVIVLVFGVMILTVGPGGDVLLDLLGVMNDNHQGYSYAASLSTLPDEDNVGAYLAEAYGVEDKLAELAGMVPGSADFEFPEMPSKEDIIAEGVSSILSF